ncbi:MAG: alanine racemase [Verrucomicrobiota bacterium]
MTLSELETPCLVLDRGKLRANARRMNEHAQRHGVPLRLHGKTAKNIEAVQAASGGRCDRLTVSTLKEADYYLAHGITDLVYAVGIAPNKVDRVIGLIRRGAQLRVLLDSLAQVRAVSERARAAGVDVPVLIEVDCDGARSGVPVAGPALAEIARACHGSAGVQLAGILTHAGGSYNCASVEEIRALAAKERGDAIRAAGIVREAGCPCEMISIGSTPTALFGTNFEGVTEIRAGVYLFQDLVMAGLGVCEVGDIALSVLVSVIGHQQDKGWIVTDGGWMALSRDRGTARQSRDRGYGLVCGVDGLPLDGLTVSSANQEHGIITSSQAIDWDRFPVGTLLRVLPNHACATGAQHDRYHVVEDSREIVAVWERINGW